MDKRVLSVLDRIAHPSTTKNDLENTALAMRRLLKGKLPSEVLGIPRTRAYDACQREINDLKVQIATIEAAKVTSEREKQRLIEGLILQISKLQAMNATQPPPIQPDGGYTRLQVSQIISERFSKEHGVRKAVVQKNAELRRCGLEVPKITDSMWQKWRIENCYPAWAIEQLKQLEPDDLLPTYKWTSADKEYLKQLWLNDPSQTNEQLAALCSQQFGHKITDCAIRGALHRLALLRPIRRLAANDPRTNAHVN